MKQCCALQKYAQNWRALAYRSNLHSSIFLHIYVFLHFPSPKHLGHSSVSHSRRLLPPSPLRARWPTGRMTPVMIHLKQHICSVQTSESRDLLHINNYFKHCRLMRHERLLQTPNDLGSLVNIASFSVNVERSEGPQQASFVEGLGSASVLGLPFYFERGFERRFRATAHDPYFRDIWKLPSQPPSGLLTQN